MAIENGLLTPEDVANAEVGNGYTHPILTALGKHSEELIHLNETCPETSDIITHDAFIRNNYGFLADAFLTEGEFNFNSLDAIAIWKPVMEVATVSSHQRSAIAQIIGVTYIIQGLENTEEWSQFPRHFFENVLERNYFPPGLEINIEDLKYIYRREQELNSEISKIDQFNISQLKGGKWNDHLAEVSENFRNGLVSLRFIIGAQIRSLGGK